MSNLKTQNHNSNLKSYGKNRLVLVVAIVFVVLAAGLNYAPQIEQWWANIKESLTQVQTETITRQKVVSEESAVIEVVEKASPAVVSITAQQVVFNPFTGPSTEDSSIGTGFIVEADGLVLTNKHVVAANNARYRVILKDGTDYEVQEIHRDPFVDLAILKINTSGLPTVTLGDSSVLKVGQTAVAIGNALGKFSNTVTVGVISGIGRGITASSGLGQSEVLDDVVQTDAALNPGNSGGPLLNLSGEVVGINVATTSGAENIGFSIPVNAIKPVLDDFKVKGRVVRPFLGVEYVIVTEDLSVLRDLPQGAFIQRVVEDTPAAEAGLKAGDIIVKIDGEDINEKNTLAQMIRRHKVGDKMVLMVDRNGQELELTATLGEAPSE
jgi:S1-C subfamily serine protease